MMVFFRGPYFTNYSLSFYLLYWFYKKGNSTRRSVKSVQKMRILIVIGCFVFLNAEICKDFFHIMQNYQTVFIVNIIFERIEWKFFFFVENNLHNFAETNNEVQLRCSETLSTSMSHESESESKQAAVEGLLRMKHSAFEEELDEVCNFFLHFFFHSLARVFFSFWKV